MSQVDFPNPGAGRLNQRVQIRLRRDVPIGLAAVVTEYPVTRQRWARIWPVGTAVWAATVQTDERVTHRCLMRYLDGVTTSHEIVHGGRVYRVRRGGGLRGERRFLVVDLEELGDEEDA